MPYVCKIVCLAREPQVKSLRESLFYTIIVLHPTLNLLSICGTKYLWPEIWHQIKSKTYSKTGCALIRIPIKDAIAHAYNIASIGKEKYI